MGREMQVVRDDGILPIYSGTIGNEEVNAVDARTLHEELQVHTMFKDWIPRRIQECDFIDGEDFCSFLSESHGGRPSREYWLTLDAAKEISMLEKNEHGKRIRRYFIKCEKELRLSQRARYQVPATYSEALMLAANQAKQLEAQASMVEAFQGFLDTANTFTMSEVAKLLYDKARIEIGRTRLFEYLKGKRVLMKNNNPYQKFVDRGLFVLRATPVGYGKTVLQTRATAEGVNFIFQLFSEDRANL